MSQEQIQRLEAQLDAKHRENAKLKALLVRCEWASIDITSNNYHFCPVCLAYRRDGHTAVCGLDDAIKEKK